MFYVNELSFKSHCYTGVYAVIHQIHDLISTMYGNKNLIYIHT